MRCYGYDPDVTDIPLSEIGRGVRPLRPAVLFTTNSYKMALVVLLGGQPDNTG